jgi:hypothetical protein
MFLKTLFIIESLIIFVCVGCHIFALIIKDKFSLHIYAVMLSLGLIMMCFMFFVFIPFIDWVIRL